MQQRSIHKNINMLKTPPFTPAQTANNGHLTQERPPKPYQTNKQISTDYK